MRYSKNRLHVTMRHTKAYYDTLWHTMTHYDTLKLPSRYYLQPQCKPIKLDCATAGNGCITFLEAVVSDVACCWWWGGWGVVLLSGKEENYGWNTVGQLSMRRTNVHVAALDCTKGVSKHEPFPKILNFFRNRYRHKVHRYQNKIFWGRLFVNYIN